MQIGSRLAVLVGAALIAGVAWARPLPRAADSALSATTTYRTVDVDGLEISCREAGPSNAPTLLLHGLPSSSAMLDALVPRLADRYHLVAPDHPGFGLSDAPLPPPRAGTGWLGQAQAGAVDGQMRPPAST